jgi:hypothetical protein
MELNKRQDQILNIIKNEEKVSISQILAYIENFFPDVSRITVNRDLLNLLELNYISKDRSGRNVRYRLSSKYNLIRPIDISEYFKVDVDERAVKEKFNFEIFTDLDNIFSTSEIRELEKLNLFYKNNVKKYQLIF